MRMLARRAGVAVGLCVALVGCSAEGGSGADDSETTSASPSATVSSPTDAVTTPTPSPSTVRSYVLDERGQVLLGAQRAALTTVGGGQVAVSGAPGSDRTVSVTAAADGVSGPWNLVVVISAQGKANEGRLIADGETFNVVPGTGLVEVAENSAGVNISTARAFTVRANTNGPNTPVTISVRGSQ